MLCHPYILRDLQQSQGAKSEVVPNKGRKGVRNETYSMVLRTEVHAHRGPVQTLYTREMTRGMHVVELNSWLWRYWTLSPAQ